MHRKKNSRQRGSKTHGWGSMKKHRGKGNKGGAGNAGTGKRGDANKPSIWANKKYFGKHGFTPLPNKVIAVNIQYLNDSADSLVKKKLAEIKTGAYVIDMSKLGINKLVSKGKASKKFDITVEKASPKAVEAIQSAGGKVTTTAKQEAKEQPKQEEQQTQKAPTPSASKEEQPAAEQPSKPSQS